MNFFIHHQTGDSLSSCYHIGPSNYVDIEPTILNTFRAHSPISFKHWSLWCPILDPHLNHTPLKYRCPIIVSVQIRPSYLIWKQPKQ